MRRGSNAATSATADLRIRRRVHQRLWLLRNGKLMLLLLQLSLMQLNLSTVIDLILQIGAFETQLVQIVAFLTEFHLQQVVVAVQRLYLLVKVRFFEFMIRPSFDL